MDPEDVIDLFLKSAARDPARPAISMRERQVSFGNLEQLARRYAAALAQGPGSSVMLALPQGEDAYAAIVGTALSGCFYAPLNISMPVDKLKAVVGRMNPDMLVATRALGSVLADAAPRARLIEPDDLPAEGLSGRGTRHEIAYVIFTSGSTGVPKGVVIPRVALNHFIQWVIRSGFILPEDRVAQFSNIAFDVSVTDIYGSLAVGARMFPIVGRSDRMFPARAIARERITVWNSVPSVIGLMMQAGDATSEKLGSLRLVNTCGEALLPIHATALFAALPRLILQNSYGPTETTVTMTELRLTPRTLAAASQTSVAIGDPISGIDVVLMGGPDENEGEIVIAGPQLAMGYWNDPERTDASFRAVSIRGRPTRAYFSGDWAVRRNGYIFFRERIDHQVKINGYRLELDEVMHAINACGFPTACALKWRDTLVAVVEKTPLQVYDEADLRARLALKLEPHAVPTKMFLIEQAPRNQNDKIDRVAIRQWLEQAEDGP